MSGGAGRERSDPEVPERARRRTFTAKYELEILAAYDAAPDGEKGALLHREGLYSSHIVAGVQARNAGALAGLAVPRGRTRREPQAEQIARLEQENLRPPISATLTCTAIPEEPANDVGETPPVGGQRSCVTVEVCVDRGLTGHSVGAQPLQDRQRKVPCRGGLRIRMQRVAVLAVLTT
jgi:hypothetical protein